MERIQQALARVDHKSLRILVTGAGGWLGRELTDLLLDSWGEDCRERLLLMATTSRTITLASGRSVQLHALDEQEVAEFAPTHIVHLAFLTRERIGQMPIAKYVATNRELTQVARRLIELDTVRGFLFSSGGAALSDCTGTDSDWYGRLKREDETIFPAAARALGKACVTARVWSCSGANMQKVELFALGSLITQARSGAPIEVRSDHPVFRRYVDVGEFLGLGLLALLHGESVVVDSAGERVEVGELAVRVAAAVAPGAAVERPEVNPAPVDDFTASPDTMAQLAERHRVEFAVLDEQISRTAAGIANCVAS